jgi:hypothetical protein
MTARAWLGRTLGVALIASAIAGCMALPRSRMLFEEPRLDPKMTLPLRAALAPLRDARPPGEQAELTPTESSPEQVTFVLLTDLSEARVFSSISLASEGQQPDVLLRGEIRSLSWKPRHNPWPYVPALGFLAEIGVPVARVVASVDIALDVTNPRTDQVIGSYRGSGREQRNLTLATPWLRVSGNGAFRAAAEQLQDAMLADRDRLLAAAPPK